jgi:hypothetical protein
MLCSNCRATNIERWLDHLSASDDDMQSAAFWDIDCANLNNCLLCSFMFQLSANRPAHHLDGALGGVEILRLEHGSWSSLKFNFFTTTPKTIYTSVYNPVNGRFKAAGINHSPADYQRSGIPSLEYVQAGGTGLLGSYRQISSERRPRLIKDWTQQCLSHHKSCNQQQDVYPSKIILIDCQSWSLHEVTPGHQPSYLSLSYVWGSCTQPQLTSGTLELWKRKDALKLISVPLTIKHAINLTIDIGLTKYLWVDSLCICQNDNELRHDQINQMYLIYSKSILTIVAAHSENANSGLMLSGGFSGIPTVRSAKIHHFPTFQLAPIWRDPVEVVSRTTWRTRGWTFQEELCSSRALVILDGFIFFSCPEALWREDVHLEQGSTEWGNGLNFIRPFLSQQSNTGPGQIKFFRGLVNQYLQRHLTRSDDVENAFAGIAGLLKPIIGDLHHGIPKSLFSEILNGCWFWDELLERRPGFPSWSWLGHHHGDIVPSLSDHSDVPLLEFYDFASTCQLLGSSRCETGYSSESHFQKDSELLETEYLKLPPEPTDKLIAFFSSVKELEVRSSLPRGRASVISPVTEYKIYLPGSRDPISSIRLHSQFVRESGNRHKFIIIAHIPDKGAFRLMLIKTVGRIVEKVNVTIPSKLVKAEDWWALEPQKELIVMG